MHTLLEQNTDSWGGTDFVANFHTLITDVLGYTLNGNYYYSPIDPMFGIKAISDVIIRVTFDGGATYFDINMVNPMKKNFYYHISNDEKVIYLRLQSNQYSSSSCDLLIAHDVNNGTVIFHGEKIPTSNSQNNKKIYMIDKTRKNYIYDEASSIETKISNDLPNMVYHVPSPNSNCLAASLYSVIKVQGFPSISNTFINFGGTPYRIVRCASVYGSVASDLIPYFAFPVSD